jgi:hypothetical protein
MAIKSCVLFILFAFAVGALCTAERPKPQAQASNGLDAFMLLRSLDVEQQRFGVGLLRAGYGETVPELIELLDTDTQRGKKQAPEKEALGWRRLVAIEALGVLRAREAIPVLVRNITFLPPAYGGSFSNSSIYPCAVALLEIGPESAEEIYAYVESCPKEDIGDDAIEAYAWVVAESARGRDRAEAIWGTIARVRRELNRAEHTENLERLLGELCAMAPIK